MQDPSHMQNEQAALLEQRGNYALVFISVAYGLVLSPYTSAWTHLFSLSKLKFWLAPPVLVLVGFSLILLEVWWAMFDGLRKLGSSFVQFVLAIIEAVIFFAIGNFIDSILGASERNRLDPYYTYLPYHAKLYSAIIILIILLAFSNFRASWATHGMRAIGIFLAALPIFSSSVTVHYLAAVALLVLCFTFTVLVVCGRFRTRNMA